MKSDINILDKILEVTKNLEELKKNQQVLVMHPSAMYICKDWITQYTHINAPLEAFMFDGKLRAYLSFYLPRNHIAVMTEAEYQEFKHSNDNIKLQDE